jgi:hypothetical protein
MDAHFAFALALLAAGHPYLGAALVLAIAIRRIGHIKISLSIGSPASQASNAHHLTPKAVEPEGDRPS